MVEGVFDGGLPCELMKITNRIKSYHPQKVIFFTNQFTNLICTI